MYKSILITGGAGFIGSHLCDFFLNQNFKVIAVDNLLTGCLKNIEHLRNNNNFEFINHDICVELPISKKIDYILHFASPASPIDYLKYPIETLRDASNLGYDEVAMYLSLRAKNIDLEDIDGETIFIKYMRKKDYNRLS